MKVLTPGPLQKGWATEAKCSGSGNGGGGCGALLLVEEEDFFCTSSHHYDGSRETYVTFKCSACGVLTDLPSHKVPAHVRKTLNNRPPKG